MTTTFIPYGQSFFQSRVEDAPVDSDRTTKFRNFMSTHPDQRKFTAPTIKGLGTNKWGTAFAVGEQGDPVWKLTGQVPSEVARLKTSGFCASHRLADQIQPTSDAPFVVLDLVNGISVWAAKSKVMGPYTISVGAAGMYEHKSNGLDKRMTPFTNSKVNYRSRGAIPDAMVIRADLVKQAIEAGTGLGHVLHMFMVETNTNDGHCFPMVGHEKGKIGFGAEGERTRIKPEVDLRKRGLSPFGLVIALTWQQNGAYFGDNAGQESTFKAEQTSVVFNPWSGTPGGVSDKCLQGKVLWDDVECVKQGWQ